MLPLTPLWRLGYLVQLGLFNSYFECKCSFREISMIKMIILDQNKPIWLGRCQRNLFHRVAMNN